MREIRATIPRNGCSASFQSMIKRPAFCFFSSSSSFSLAFLAKSCKFKRHTTFPVISISHAYCHRIPADFLLLCMEEWQSLFSAVTNDHWGEQHVFFQDHESDRSDRRLLNRYWLTSPSPQKRSLPLQPLWGVSPRQKNSKVTRWHVSHLTWHADMSFWICSSAASSS